MFKTLAEDRSEGLFLLTLLFLHILTNRTPPLEININQFLFINLMITVCVLSL